MWTLGVLEGLARDHDVLGLTEVDTRALTRHARSRGAMEAVVSTDNLDPEELLRKARRSPGLVGRDLVEGPAGLDTAGVAAASTTAESAAVAAAPKAPAADVTLGLPPIAPPAAHAVPPPDGPRPPAGAPPQILHGGPGWPAMPFLGTVGKIRGMSSLRRPPMTVQQTIEAKLSAGFSPLHLEVVNESHMHSVPPGAESHFKVLVVSEGFSADRPLARHRRVNGLLAGEFQTGLHALAIHAWTPQEWYAKGGIAPASPQCMGGSKAG